jgi:hypothetical protein
MQAFSTIFVNKIISKVIYIQSFLIFKKKHDYLYEYMSCTKKNKEILTVSYIHETEQHILLNFINFRIGIRSNSAIYITLCI